jgi:hypothetical protein
MPHFQSKEIEQMIFSDTNILQARFMQLRNHFKVAATRLLTTHNQFNQSESELSVCLEKR